jgi:hypothetical protein
VIAIITGTVCGDGGGRLPFETTNANTAAVDT